MVRYKVLAIASCEVLSIVVVFLLLFCCYFCFQDRTLRLQDNGTMASGRLLIIMLPLAGSSLLPVVSGVPHIAIVYVNHSITGDLKDTIIYIII